MDSYNISCNILYYCKYSTTISLSRESLVWYKYLQLPLFIRGELETIKINCGGPNFEEPMFVYILKQEIEYLFQGLWQLVASCLASLSILIYFQIAVKWLCFSLLCIIDFFTKTDPGDKIKYCELSKNKKRE